MLDDQHGVAALLELAQHGDQPFVVARVQADGRLVQHIEHANQTGADLRRQPDTLHLAAREGRAFAVEREVIEPHVVQELQASADLLQHLAHGRRIGGGERKRFEKGQALLDRHGHDFHDRTIRHGAGARLCSQSYAMAFRTDLAAHVAPQLLAHLVEFRLAVAPRQTRQHAFKGLLGFTPRAAHPKAQRDRLIARAVQQHLTERLRQLVVGRVHVDLVGRGHRLEQMLVVHHHAEATVPPGMDRAIGQRQRLVGHHEVLVKDQLRTEARAGRTGTERVVEGKRARFQFLKADRTIWTGILFGKEFFARVAFWGHALHKDQALALLERQFDRIGQAPPYVLPGDQPIHHGLDGVLFVFVEARDIFERQHLAVDAHAYKPLAADRLKHLFVASLATAHQRREHHQPCADGLRQQMIDDLLRALPLYRLAATRAMRMADATVEQAQVVVDFGHSRHDRARIPARCTLLDRDRGRKRFNVVDLRLLHLVEKLPRVGGEALDIAPLAFGVQGIEGERRLAGTAEAGHHGQ